MPVWLQIGLGIVVGVAAIALIVMHVLRAEARPSKGRKSWLAPPSGDEGDTGGG